MSAANLRQNISLWSWIARGLAPLLAVAILVPVALSPGYQEADEINHFLIAREALHTWSSRLDIWGRSGCTLFFALITPLGLTAARLLAAGVTLGVCWGIVRLARGLLPEPEAGSWFDEHRDFFLFLLPFALPPFLLFSASVMTEMLLAFAWTWAAVALVSRRPLLASILLGLGGLARPEGFFAIAAWPVLLFLLRFVDQKIAAWRIGIGTFLAGLPVLAWYVTGAVFYASVKWPLEHWPWQVHSQYGASFMRFLGALFSFGDWVWIAILAGTTALLVQWISRWVPQQPRGFEVLPMPPGAEESSAPPPITGRTVAFLLVPPAGLILLHGILGAFGLFGSLPMPRYFICIAPFLVIVAVHGLSLLARVLTGKVVAIGAAAGMAFLILLPFWRGDLPIRMRLDGIFIDAAVQALPAIVPPDQWEKRVIAFHPYARYRLGFQIQKEVYAHSLDRGYLANAPLGTVVFSDDDLCAREGLPQAADFYAWGYVLDPELQEKIAAAYRYPAYLHVFVWFKKSQTRP